MKTGTDILAIEKFNVSRIRTGSPAILVLGRRDTGKSWMLRDLFVHSDVECPGLVIAGGSKNDVVELYKGLVPEENIHADELSSEIVNSFIEQHRGIFEKDQFASTAVVLDNCFDNNQYLKDFVAIDRSYNVTKLISKSYCAGLHPNFDNHITYVFILPERNRTNLRRIYEAYASFFGTFDDFCTVFDSVAASKYDCMVIDNSVGSNATIEQRVFWYKAGAAHPTTPNGKRVSQRIN